MICVQIFLPIIDESGGARPHRLFARVQEELTTRFGGVTAFVNAPAEGRWQVKRRRTVHDEIVVIEVMVKRLNRKWWKRYKRDLEGRFKQESIVVRALPMELL